ncbi:MAG: AMP-binding protein [Rhodospirillales bacterium]|nr:AMP-binding protein [Rhodospirillales bacterium]
MRETLSGFLEALAGSAPSAPAILGGGRAVSFGTLDDRSRRVARGLSDLGVGRGDRVAIWLPNVPAWLELYFACARLGAVAVALNTRYRSSEVGGILGASGAKVLALWPGFRKIDFLGILGDAGPAALAALDAVVVYGEGEEGDTPSKLFGDLKAVRYGDLARRPAYGADDARADDACTIFTTSGTTRAPKLVLHHQRAITRHAAAVARHFGYAAPDAVMLQGLPLCGTFGLAQAMASLAGGRPMVLTPAFDGDEAATLIKAHAVTHMNGSDEMYRRILDAAVVSEAGGEPPFPALRQCGFAAFTADPVKLVAEGDRRAVPFVGLYGMSEVQALFSVRPVEAPAVVRAQAGGTPVSPEARVRVRDPDTGALLADGENGEVEISGPSIMAGYDGDKAATKETLTEDGFVRTGDLGHTTQDGAFVFLDRMGDAMRLGGFLVAPEEISAFVETHPMVRGCQVVGVEAEGGPGAVAFVIANPGAGFSEDDLRAHCRAGMAGYKVPRRFLAIEEFPTTDGPNGVKIQRARLRRMAAELEE